MSLCRRWLINPCGGLSQRLRIIYLADLLIGCCTETYAKYHNPLLLIVKVIRVCVSVCVCVNKQASTRQEWYTLLTRTQNTGLLLKPLDEQSLGKKYFTKYPIICEICILFHYFVCVFLTASLFLLSSFPHLAFRHK